MQEPPRPPAPAALLAIAFVSFIALGLQGGALGVAWLSMQEGFGRGLESLGVLLLALTAGSFAISVVSGRIIAAVGLGWYLLGGALLGLIGLIATSVTPSWSGLVAASLLLGLGRGAIDAGINTFVAHSYPASRMNWLHAIFGGGATLGPLLVTFVVVTLARPWQLGYAAMAVFQLIVVALFAATFRRWRLDEAPERRERNAPPPRPLQSLRLVAVWLGIGLFVLHAGLQMSAGQLVNNLFVDGRGIDPGVAGLWIGLFWGFITLGRILFAGVIDRLGTARVLRFATVGTVLGAALLWWSPTDTIDFVGLAVMGLTLAPIFPSSVSRTPGLVGSEHAPNAIGFELAGASIGMALLPGLTGLLGERVGLEVIPPSLVVMALVQVLLHEGISAHERHAARRGV
jgi:fucose permease